MNKIINTLIVCTTLFAAFVIYTYQIYFALFGTVILSLVLAGGVVWLADYVWDKIQDNRHLSTMRRIEADAAKAQHNHDNVTVITAKAGEQVFIGAVADSPIGFSPAHLGGQVNGGWQVTDKQLAMQDRFNALFAPSHNQKQLPPGDVQPAPLPKLLDELRTTRRVLVVANSDGGKSTFAKHFISMHRDGEIIVIDPHAPSHILGINVVGAGENWAEIDNGLNSLLEIMELRYQDIKLGRNHYGEGNISDHPKMVVTIDELTGIIDECDNASNVIKSLLARSRKVNMIICLLYHSFNVTELGISSGIRASAQLVHLRGGNGRPYEAYLIPQTTGKIPAEKHWTRCETAGPFAGDVNPATVRATLPDAKLLKVANLTSQNFSPTAIARAVNNVDKATGPQINEINKIIATLEATFSGTL